MVAGLSAPALAAPQQVQSQVPEIVTTGEAVVRRAPDRAFFTVTAESRARSPRDAQQENARMMTSVQDKLKGAGIAKEAIRTLGYTVEPEFDFANNRRTLRDYVARNTIEVKVDDLDRLGEMIDAAVSAGATSVGDVRFDLKDRKAAEREALRQAVVDARARAEAAAAGADRTIDHIIRIQENGTEPIEPPRPVMMAVRAGGAAPETPITAGDIEIRARVTLTAAIK
jgi:uncharacterized protein YggE